MMEHVMLKSAFLACLCTVHCIQDMKMQHAGALFADVKDKGFRASEAFYDSSINVFLLEKDGMRFLIDAGNDPSRGSLKEKLEKMKVPADSIKGVFITHIHPDHVGGLLWEGKALFPQATIYIAADENRAWRKDGNRTALGKYLMPYQKRIQQFEYEKPLPGGLLPVKKAGHTPGHTVYRLKTSAGAEVCFAGDILHAVSLQVPRPTICARYDSEPEKAVASRLEVLGMKAVHFGAHFPFPGCAEIRPEGGTGGFVYVPFRQNEP